MCSTLQDNQQHHPTLNVELLGKPIHTIRDELRKILEQSTTIFNQEVQKWMVKTPVSISFEDIAVNFSSTAHDIKTLSIFCHERNGVLGSYLNKDLLLTLSDEFYGSNVKRIEKSKTAVITNSDLRLQQRLGRLIANAIAPDNMWKNSDVAPSNDIGLSATFQVSCGDVVGVLTVILDSILIQTLIDELDLQHNFSNVEEQFNKVLENTPVKMRAVLSKKVMPLSQVLALQPNDIIPIELLSNAPVSIGQEHLFNGQVAEQNGQLVLILKDSKDSQ